MHRPEVLVDVTRRMIAHHVAGTTTEDHCQLFQITPGAAVDRTVTRQSYYSRGPLDDDERRFLASAQFDLFHGVVRDEDFPCTEEMQAALRSGANTHYTFGRNEPALQHLHRAYEEALR